MTTIALHIDYYYASHLKLEQMQPATLNSLVTCDNDSLDMQCVHVQWTAVHQQVVRHSFPSFAVDTLYVVLVRGQPNDKHPKQEQISNQSHM